MNHPCDRRTDGQRDGIAIAYARLAYMLSSAKKKKTSAVKHKAFGTNIPGGLTIPYKLYGILLN